MSEEVSNQVVIQKLMDRAALREYEIAVLQARVEQLKAELERVKANG